MSNEGWKQVRVYIASGYFDMEGERQVLFNETLPELSLMCVPLRVVVNFVDLRVGLHEHQWWALIEKAGCIPLLAEIDRCSPYFVGLYGAKYGKQMKTYKFPIEPRWTKIQKSFPKGRSVLELETYWAALRDPSRCLPIFCFRDNSFLKSKQFLADKDFYCAAELSPPLTSRYPERKTDAKIGVALMPENDGATKLLKNLRKQITVAYQELQPNCFLFDYSCEYKGPVKQLPMVGKLEALKEHVKMRLYEYIVQTCPSTSIAADLLEIDSSYHKAVLDQQLQFRFVGRQAEHDKIIDYCTDINDEDGSDIYDIVPFIVHGRAGSGNSCLVANVIDTMRDDKNLRDHYVLYHFVGASPSSSNVRMVLTRICSLLQRKFDLNFVLPDDFPSLSRCFRLLIKYIIKIRNRKLFLFLDGVDQLDPEYHGQMLHWIPHTSKARIICTMHTGTPTHLAVVQRYETSIKTLEVGDMARQACVELLAERLYKVQKSMSVSQISKLLAKTDGKRPLYLALAGNEVMEFGKWNASISLDGVMETFVDDMADTVVGLCKQAISRWIDDFPADMYGNMVIDTLCLLACSRHGLSEDEIRKLNPHLDPRCFDGAGIKHPDVPLPMLMYADFYERLDPFMRATPRNRVQNMQFRDWSFLRGVQKLYFPDQPRAASMWLKIFGFVVARRKAAEFSTSGASGLEMAADAMKNMTSRNAEERYHSQISKYFQQKEEGGGRGAWSGRYQRTLLELPYHLIMGRMWSQLESTLLDLRFIESKFRIRMGHDLVQNFVFAVQAKAPEAAKTGRWGPTHKKIQDIHRFVAQNFDTLTMHAGKTFQLAANNADTATLAKVALVHWQQQSIRSEWANYLNKPSELNPLILMMPGHTAPITKVVFTSDGLRLMSASMDSSIRLWDAFSGELIGTINAHNLPIQSVSFVQGDGGMNVRGVISSSDVYAITASRDKSLKLWHLDSSKEMKHLTGHVGRIMCCAVKVRNEYDDESGELVKKTFVATGSWDRSCMIWDLDTGEVLHRLGGAEHLNTCPNSDGHFNAVTDVSFSPDGSVVCTGSEDETIRLWNRETGELLKSYSGHDNGITSVDYCSTGEYILSASTDGTLKMWDTAEAGGATQSFFDHVTQTWVKIRSEVVTFVGNLDRVMEGRMSADMQSVVSGCRDGTVRIYAATITPGMREMRLKGGFVTISPRITLFGHMGGVNTVAISPDSWRVSTAGDDGAVRVWDLGGTGTPEKQGHEDACLGIAYLPYGDKVVTCGQEGTLKLWDGKEGLFEKQVISREERFLACAVDPLGKKVAVACDDGVLRVYELERSQVLITQRHSFKPVKCAVFSNGQGYNICTGAEDGTVKFWNAETGELKCTIDAHVTNPQNKSKRQGKSVNGVSYDMGNFKLVSGSDDMSVRLWYRKVDAAHPTKGKNVPPKRVVVNTGEDGDDGMTDDERMYHRMMKAMQSRRNEKLAEMTHEDRLARQKRKDREAKIRVADRQARYSAGEDPDQFSSSDDDSILNDQDVLALERELLEEGDEVEVQRVIVGPQEWLLAASMIGHKAAVLGVAYHPNGEQVVSCSRDGCIKVWSASCQQLEEELFGKPPPPPAAAPTQKAPVTSDNAKGAGERKASSKSLKGKKDGDSKDETQPLLSNVGEEDEEGEEGEDEDEDEDEADDQEDTVQLSGEVKNDPSQGEGEVLPSLLGDPNARPSPKPSPKASTKGDAQAVQVAGGKFGPKGGKMFQVAGRRFGGHDSDDDGSEYTWSTASTSHQGSRMNTFDTLGSGTKGSVKAPGVPATPRDPAGGNTCLYSIDVKFGPIRQIAFSPDGLVLVAACEGHVVKGSLMIYDGTTYARIGDFETASAALSCAAAGMAPHMLSCGDMQGNFYLLRFGAMQPNTPKPTRVLPDPLPMSRMCTIL